MKRSAALAVSLALLGLASVHAQTVTDGKPRSGGTEPARTKPFAEEKIATLQEPWAMAFEPGTGRLFVTEKAGTIKVINPDRSIGTISGAPAVAYGGQGGLGDIAFAPDYAKSHLIYLTFAEQGEGTKRNAAMGRGKLTCASPTSCAVENFTVIWRQTPQIDSPGHFSHRMLFSKDGKYLFLTSGERMQFTPAQDLSVNLGKVLRLLPDGSPAPGNPFADKGGVSAQIWTYGHRNLLGLAWDARGRLWEMEHGPKGGDEINLIQPGKNYGWPLVSYGDNYDGTPIPAPSTRPEFQGPAIYWNPVIAPGGMLLYSGSLFPAWNGHVLLPGLASQALIDVQLSGDTGTEVARYPMGTRMRAIVQAPDGSVWVAQDGKDAAILRLTPAR